MVKIYEGQTYLHIKFWWQPWGIKTMIYILQTEKQTSGKLSKLSKVQVFWGMELPLNPDLRDSTTNVFSYWATNTSRTME
jgi:hypothetical protein